MIVSFTKTRTNSKNGNGHVLKLVCIYDAGVGRAAFSDRCFYEANIHYAMDLAL